MKVDTDMKIDLSCIRSIESFSLERMMKFSGATQNEYAKAYIKAEPLQLKNNPSNSFVNWMVRIDFDGKDLAKESQIQMLRNKNYVCPRAAIEIESQLSLEPTAREIRDQLDTYYKRALVNEPLRMYVLKEPILFD